MAITDGGHTYRQFGVRVSQDRFELLRVLKERLGEVASPLGLELRQFAPIIADQGGTDHLQAIFVIDLEAVGRTEDEMAFNKEFESIEKELRLQHDKEQAEAARKNLEALLKKTQKEK